MNRLAGALLIVLLVSNIVLLIIPGVGIAIGLTNRNVIQPIIKWANDPGPMFVDDDRCCR